MTGLLRPSDWRPLLELLVAERAAREARFDRPAHAYAQTTRHDKNTANEKMQGA
jgi:hypothetical protein